jgi:isopropylmalate/homocitrate/citramalate synthase
MEYADYLREEALRLRQSAEHAQEPAVADELQELAAVCERVAAELEDRRLPG